MNADGRTTASGGVRQRHRRTAAVAGAENDAKAAAISPGAELDAALDFPDMSSRWQLLERPKEQATIRAALTGDEQHGVVLIGPAGVGKTTLARTVTDKLSSAVHWAACTESSQTIPLGAFMQWVGSSGARDPIALLAAARESILAGAEPVVGVDDPEVPPQAAATSVTRLASTTARRDR